MMLPIADKEIVLKPARPKDDTIAEMKPRVVVHPGMSWQTKTFPKDWWDAVLREFVAAGEVPVVIGSKCVVVNDQTIIRGTVDVNTEGCVDLRDKTSFMDMVWILQHSQAVVSNDSSPVHAAASGDAWIHAISTAKHPDLIKHWRHGQFGWHMKDHALGGCWNTLDYAPNKLKGVDTGKVPEEMLRSWLPDPKKLVTDVLETIK